MDLVDQVAASARSTLHLGVALQRATNSMRLDVVRGLLAIAVSCTSALSVQARKVLPRGTCCGQCRRFALNPNPLNPEALNPKTLIPKP